MQQLPKLGIFEGSPQKLYFTNNIKLLEVARYRLAGRMVAWSILHDGPGIACLHPALWAMMTKASLTSIPNNIDIQDVTDEDVCNHLKRVCECLTKPTFPGDPNFSIKILYDPKQKKC